jgi:hypothetical protein
MIWVREKTDRHAWHNWFAWFPVVLNSWTARGKTIKRYGWLTTVRRKYFSSEHAYRYSERSYK